MGERDPIIDVKGLNKITKNVRLTGIRNEDRTRDLLHMNQVPAQPWRYVCFSSEF